jgi:hypothetical protein
MYFSFHVIESLPKLAWCAVLKQCEEVIQVYLGPWVEKWPRFFVEGAWNGTFPNGDFDSAYLMGSGARLIGDKVVFCTPYHSHERLHFLRTGSELFVSPSLAFLLKQSGRSLDMRHIPYQAELVQMLFGMEYHIGAIPIEKGERIDIYHFRNLEVDTNLEITVKHKQESPEFTSYEDYRQFLLGNLADIANNALSEHRKVQYPPIATISSGYDSAACAVLSTEIGCTEAVTMRSARPEPHLKGDYGDSGKRVGEILGLRVTEYDRSTYMNMEGTPEAEFVASGDLGQDFVLCAFEGAWRQRMVIFGNHGDYVWKRQRLLKFVNTKLYRNDTGGDCLVDFRSRVGFIALYLPFIGALGHPFLHRISNSDEMKRWSVGGIYDKPIARRIVEEKGVPRSLFGQKKRAVTVLLNRDRNLSLMNQNSLESFKRFYESHRLVRNRIKQLSYDVLFWFRLVNSRLVSKLNRAFNLLGTSIKIPCLIPFKFSEPPGRPSFLIHWGISLIADRYKTAEHLAQGDPEDLSMPFDREK